MHLPIAYESYLNKEIIKHMIASNNGDEYPAWLVLEEETYNWIRNLERKLMFVIWSRIVSKEFLERIGKIPTIRFSRYRDISPSLKELTAASKRTDPEASMLLRSEAYALKELRLRLEKKYLTGERKELSWQ